MAYKKSNKSITNEQFSDNTTIDGLRVDKALDDMLNKVNNLQSSDLSTRYVKSQFIAGWSPSQDYIPVGAPQWAPRLPFLPVINNDVNTVSTGAYTYDERGQNEWRHKGFNVSTINPANTNPTDIAAGDGQWAWTTSYEFIKPVILDEITYNLRVDGDFGGQLWNRAIPVAQNPESIFTTNKWVDDIVVQLQVDSNFNVENTSQSDLELNKWYWTADSFLIESAGVVTPFPTNDMDPPLIGSALDRLTGVSIELKNLNIPIHQFARVRVALILPSYESVVAFPGSFWGDDPWSKCAFDFSMTVLEEIEK